MLWFLSFIKVKRRIVLTSTWYLENLRFASCFGGKSDVYLESLCIHRTPTQVFSLLRLIRPLLWTVWASAGCGWLTDSSLTLLISPVSVGQQFEEFGHLSKRPIEQIHSNHLCGRAGPRTAELRKTGLFLSPGTFLSKLSRVSPPCGAEWNCNVCTWHRHGACLSARERRRRKEQQGNETFALLWFQRTF